MKEFYCIFIVEFILRIDSSDIVRMLIARSIRNRRISQWIGFVYDLILRLKKILSTVDVITDTFLSQIILDGGR